LKVVDATVGLMREIVGLRGEVAELEEHPWAGGEEVGVLIASEKPLTRTVDPLPQSIMKFLQLLCSIPQSSPMFSPKIRSNPMFVAMQT